MRIAIVGTGISGLAAARALAQVHDVTVFEAADRPGGHTNTVRVDLGDETHEVDTGFIVFNEPNYPRFTRLLDELQIETAMTEMSFSVTDERSGVVWSGRFPGGVFAQRRNAFRPAFWRMLADVTRFNRRARQILESQSHPDVSLEDLLSDGRWSSEFVNWYLVPLGSAIWSADPGSFADIPADHVRPVLRQPRLAAAWRPARVAHDRGRRRRYVDAILRPLAGTCGATRRRSRRSSGAGRRKVELRTADGARASSTTSSSRPTATRPCASWPTRRRRNVRSSGPSDTSPTGPRSTPTGAPAAGTGARGRAGTTTARPTTGRGRAVTYSMNRLQGIRSRRRRSCVTLNREDEIDPDRGPRTPSSTTTPCSTPRRCVPSGRHGEISGQGGTSFAGAYWGYGFHEDGVQERARVCAGLGVEPPGEQRPLRGHAACHRRMGLLATGSRPDALPLPRPRRARRGLRSHTRSGRSSDRTRSRSVAPTSSATPRSASRQLRCATWWRSGIGRGPRVRSACSPTSAPGAGCSTRSPSTCCTDAGGDRIEALVLEVTNTPWHERHAYVLDGGAGEHRFAKALHVSPFFGMDQRVPSAHRSPGECVDSDREPH